MIRDFIKGRRKALSGTADTEVGIGGFRLFAKVADSTNYKASVPSTVLENGVVAGDQIIRDPLTITITGEVAETQVRLAETPAVVQQLDAVVGNITAFLPNRTQSQINRIRTIGQSAMDAVDKVDRVINIAKDGYNALGGSVSGKPIREQFIDYIESVYYGNQLIEIDGVYRTHTRMAITSLTLSRNNEDETIRFELQLQKVDTTRLIDVDISEFYQAPAPDQTAATTAGATDQGAQDAEAGQTKSLASALLGR